MTKWQKLEYLAILLIILGASWMRKIVFSSWEMPLLVAYGLVLIPAVFFLCGVRFKQHGKLYLLPFVLHFLVTIFSCYLWHIYRIYERGYDSLYRDLVDKHGIPHVAWGFLSSRLPGVAWELGLCVLGFLLGYGLARRRDKESKKKFPVFKIAALLAMLLVLGIGIQLYVKWREVSREKKIPVWIEQLAHKDPKVRENAASNLEDLTEAGFWEVNLDDIEVEKLFQVLDDPNPKVRVGALSFLSYLGGGGLVAKQKVDATRVEKLMQILDDPDPKVRVEVLSFLRHLGGREIVEKVKLKLKDEDAEVRTKAAVAVFRLRPLGDIGPLIVAAEDESEEVRGAVAAALGKSKYPEAYQVLLKLSQDESQSVRARAIAGLGDLWDKKAVPLIIAALDDQSPEVRWWSCTALRYVGGKESIRPLIEVLGKKDVDVRGGSLHETANLALFQITLQEGVEGYESWNNWWKENKDTFDPVERAREVLRSEASEMDLFPVFRRIAFHRMTEFKPRLRNILSERDKLIGGMAKWSATTLAEWGELDGLAYFFSELKDPHSTDRPLSMYYLRRLTGQFFYGDPEAWLKWWDENKSRIRWNEKHHIFEVVGDMVK